MPKESTIQHYSSSTTGATPAAIDLSTGELAINIADEKVFFKNLGGTVVSLSQTKDLSGAFAASSNVVSSVNGATGAYSLPLATASLTGVASFPFADFAVSNGSVSLTGNVARKNIDNSFTTAQTILFGGNNTQYGFATQTSNWATNTYTVQTPDASATVSFPTQSGTLALERLTVSSLNGLTGARTLTGDGGAIRGDSNTAITARVATSSLTGVASFNTTDFTVASGAVSLTNAARTNAANTFTSLQTFSAGLSGDLTGNATTVTVTDTNTGTRFLCMVGGTGQTGIFIDRTTTPLQYTPSLGRITLQSLQATSAGISTTLGSTGIVSTSILSCSVAESMDFVTTSTNPVNSSIYFVTPNGDVAFGDVYGSGSQNAFTVIPGNNIMAYSASSGANIGKLKFGINRNGLGWTGQFGYGIELGQDSSRMLRMTRILNTATDQSTTGPTCNATFELSDSGDLTIKPSGGDLVVSGSLTVTGTGLSGNVVVNNQLNVLAGGTFAASTDVYFGGSTRGIIINGGKGTSDISSYGTTELNIDAYNGNGIANIRAYYAGIGDVDGNQNSTYIAVDDGVLSINHEASNGHNFGGSRINALAGITAASLYISGGATFDGNTTIGNAATDTTTIYGSKVVNEFVFNNGTARTVGISWANGNVQLLDGTGSGATGVTAIYFTNPPATGSASVTLIVTSGGNMTGNTNFWATNIKWPGGNKPTLSSNGTPDVISFVTPDAGTTIYGFVGGLNFA